jgi:hypothetical protein
MMSSSMLPRTHLRESTENFSSQPDYFISESSIAQAVEFFRYHYYQGEPSLKSALSQQQKQASTR